MMRDGSVSVLGARAGTAGLCGWGGVAFAVAAAAVMMFAGCRKPVPTSRPSEAAYDPRTDPLVNPPALLEPAPADASLMESDETLFLHLDGSPNTLTPLFLSTGVEQHVAGTIFTGPFTIDKDMKWRLDEDVVESFEESGDHMEFTLRLKPGLRWHDGTPFTAHDIVYSFEQIRDPRVPAQTEKSSVEPIRECKALDDRTVKYVMREAIATARWALSFAIVPRHVFEKDKENNPDLKSGSYYAQLGRAPIGNGRYRFVEWKENDKIVVERWDGYSGRKPHFKRVVFRIIPDNNVTLLSFEKQDIDAIERLSSQQFARETNTESFKKVGYKGWDTEWAYGYIGWNLDGSNPFFGDRRVRYAMTHALNIPLIIEKLTYNLASQSYGIYHPKSWMFNPEVKLLPYDLARSAQLLDEAGWQVDSQDGWRYKEVNGRRMRFHAVGAAGFLGRSADRGDASGGPQASRRGSQGAGSGVGDVPREGDAARVSGADLRVGDGRRPGHGVESLANRGIQDRPQLRRLLEPPRRRAVCEGTPGVRLRGASEDLPGDPQDPV